MNGILPAVQLRVLRSPIDGVRSRARQPRDSGARRALQAAFGIAGLDPGATFPDL